MRVPPVLTLCLPQPSLQETSPRAATAGTILQPLSSFKLPTPTPSGLCNCGLWRGGCGGWGWAEGQVAGQVWGGDQGLLVLVEA